MRLKIIGSFTLVGTCSRTRAQEVIVADDDRLFILSAIDGDFAAVDDGASRRLVALDRL